MSDGLSFHGRMSELNAPEYRRPTLGMLAVRAVLMVLVVLLWWASWQFLRPAANAALFLLSLLVVLIGYAALSIRIWRWRDTALTLAFLVLWDLLAVTLLVVLSGGLKSPFLLLFLAPVLGVFYYGNAFFTNRVTAVTILCLTLVSLADLFVPLPGVLGPAMTLAGAAAYRAPIVFVLLMVMFAINLAAIGRTARMNEKTRLLEKHLAEAGEELTRAFYDLEAALERARANEQHAYHARQQLLRAERFSATAKLAAGILHDIANPLSIIMSDSEMFLLKYNERADKAKETIRRVLTNAQHISMLLDNLRLLTKQRGDAVWAPVDMKHLVMRCLSTLEPERRRRGIVVDTQLETDAPKLLGVESQLEQMTVNLLMNAFEAVNQPGGRVNVRTRVNGERFQLEVEDDGEGIAKQYLEKIFEPFFTTRASHLALGLGLFSALSIVQEHSGAIAVRSDPGVATVFSVELPFQPTRRG